MRQVQLFLKDKASYEKAHWGQPVSAALGRLTPTQRKLLPTGAWTLCCLPWEGGETRVPMMVLLTCGTWCQN